MGTHNPWSRRPTGPLGRRLWVEAAYGDDAGPSPTEWQGLAGEKLPCEAERRLWLAVVEAAVVDAVGLHLVDCRGECLACDGWRWLKGEAFAAVAESLGLDPDAVRSRLAREVAAHGADGGALDRASRRRRFQAATRRRRGHTAVGARELH